MKLIISGNQDCKKVFKNGNNSFAFTDTWFSLHFICDASHSPLSWIFLCTSSLISTEISTLP